MSSGVHQLQSHQKKSSEKGNTSEKLACSTCGKEYSFKHNLLRHVRFECDGQRRFCCRFCPNKYTQNVSLRRHLIQQHNIVPVPKKKNMLPQSYNYS